MLEKIMKTLRSKSTEDLKELLLVSDGEMKKMINQVLSERREMP